MKAIFAALLVLIALAFAFTSLPRDFAGYLEQTTNINGFLRAHLLTPLLEKVAGGKNPDATRLELIDKIEGSLADIEKALPAASTTPRAETDTAKTPQELVAETRDLLEELKSNNGNTGVVQSVTDRLVSRILPASNACSKQP